MIEYSETEQKINDVLARWWHCYEPTLDDLGAICAIDQIMTEARAERIEIERAREQEREASS